MRNSWDLTVRSYVTIWFGEEGELLYFNTDSDLVVFGTNIKYTGDYSNFFKFYNKKQMLNTLSVLKAVFPNIEYWIIENRWFLGKKIEREYRNF